MRGPDLLLAIDAGGSVLKVTVFPTDGTKPATVAEPIPLSHPDPGKSERDPELLWQTVIGCIRRALSPAEGIAGNVLAVGLTSHGNGLYLVDDRGLPTRAAIMAADTRAAPKVRQWVADGLNHVLQARSWSGLWAGQPGPILSSLAVTEPEVLASSFAAISCKDYLWSRLTGVVEVELSAASTGALYDNTAWAAAKGSQPLELNELAIDGLGLDPWRRLLHPPIPSETTRTISTEAAELTGLAVGTPVVAGLVDNAAMHHGSGVFDGTAICIGAGTWGINQLLVSPTEAIENAVSGEVRPNAASIALGGTVLLCEASPSSASNLDWALTRAVRARALEDTARGADIFVARLAREGHRELRLDDPMFLPFIDGSRADSGARGAWIGLSSSSGEEEMLGAVVEGICLEHRRHIDRLRSIPSESLPVRLSGGATKSEVWCQRFADVLAVPVQVSPVAELGSVCAAAMAGSYAGIFPDVPAGVQMMNPVWRDYYPNPAASEYETARYERYRAVAEIFENLPWSG